jgi:FlaA1/EpsC-like NDP-sugar epimerase
MLTLFEKYPNQLLLLRKHILSNFSRYSLARWTVFLLDILAVIITFFIAYLLRFDFVINDFFLDHVIIHGLITAAVYGTFALVFRSYAGLIRHTTLTDISLVFTAVSASAAVLLLISQLTRIFYPGSDLIVPFSIILIHYGLVTVVLFVVRIAIKLLFRFATRSLNRPKNVLIYGAGELGFIVKRIILSDPKNNFNVTGFFDDSKKLQGKKINGIPVYNPEILSANFLLRNNIQTLILAIRNVSPGRKSEIIRTAIDLGLEILETPSVEKWRKGQPEIRHFQSYQVQNHER